MNKSDLQNGIKGSPPKAYIPTAALADKVEFDNDMMYVSLTDGRIIGVPIIWFPYRELFTIRKKYALDYATFAQYTAEDEDFVQHIEDNISKTWEIDLADWEFCHKGIQDWTRKLESILPT